MSKPARVIAVTAVINIIFIAIVVWFLVLNKTIVPLYGIGLNRKLDLSFLAMPLIGYFSLQLLSELVDVALTGSNQEGARLPAGDGAPLLPPRV